MQSAPPLLETLPAGAADPPAGIGAQPAWRGLALAAILVLSTVAVYWSAIGGAFVFDDLPQIVDRARGLKMEYDPASLLRPRGLVDQTFVANFKMMGGRLSASVYRGTNVAIHIVTALLLFWLVRQTLRRAPGVAGLAGYATGIGFFVALLWVLHPLQTQAVTYVVQRYESMMAMFAVAALCCVALSLRKQADGVSVGGSLWRSLAVGCALLSFACKESGAVTPVLLLLYDRAYSGGTWGGTLRRWAPYLLGSMVLSLPFLGVVRQVLWTAGDAGFRQQLVSPAEYAVSQPGVILFYLRLLFWPNAQAADYGWPIARGVSEIALPGAILLAIFATTAWLVVRRPAAALLPAAFFITLAPSSSFVPIVDLAFDHRMYVPSMAAIALVVIVVARWLARAEAATAGWVLGIVAAVALGLAVDARNRVWKSEFDCWQDVVEKRPANSRGWTNLGNCFVQRRGEGDQQRAIDCFDRALKLKPNSYETQTMLAMALIELPDDHPRRLEALEHCRRAVEGHPDDPRTASAMAYLLVRLNRLEPALVQWRRAVELQPANTVFRYNLASCLDSMGKHAEAAAELEDALRRDPDFERAKTLLAQQRQKQAALAEGPSAQEWYERGQLLVEQGAPAEAYAAYKAALRADPKHAKTHNNLANMLRDVQPELAEEHYRLAIDSDPQYALAYYNYGVVLGKQGRWEEAERRFASAAAIDPNLPGVQQNLGVARKQLAKSAAEQATPVGAEASP